MTPYRLVDNAAALDTAAHDLKQTLSQSPTPRLYLDTEFESNRSGTKLCLLQLSAGDTIYLVDPLRLRELSALSGVLSEKRTEWVLHAGLQDVELITREFGVSAPHRLFDTQIAWALLGPEASVSLAYLKFKLLGLRSEKGHQADDWVRRPFQESQLRYAASDVEQLPKMTEMLLEKAEVKERIETIYAACHDTLNPEREPPPPLSLSSFRNAWQLSAESQAALRYLMEWYNALPLEERRSAPEPKTLLSIASRSPTDVGSLSRIKGVPRSTVSNHGAALVSGLVRAQRSAKGEDFAPLDPPPYATFGDIRLEAWLFALKSELAISMEFAPELVLPGRLLRRIKDGMEAEGLKGLFESLVGWRKDFLATKVAAFCETSPPPV